MDFAKIVRIVLAILIIVSLAAMMVRYLGVPMIDAGKTVNAYLNTGYVGHGATGHPLTQPANMVALMLYGTGANFNAYGAWLASSIIVLMIMWLLWYVFSKVMGS